LPADKAAALCDCSPEELSRREHAGELFSFLVSSRGSQRMFVAFQFLDPYQGAVVSRLLEALGHPAGDEAYVFFCGLSEFLGGLSATEVLVGRTARLRVLDEWACGALALTFSERFELALVAAKQFKDSQPDW
jgi:hypothetical protein